MPNTNVIRRTSSGNKGPANPETNAWALAVIANGGSRPSSTTLSAVDAYISTEKSNGIWNSLNIVNIVAPDSLIAMRTPLKQGCGVGFWRTPGVSPLYTLDVNGIRRANSAGYFDIFDGSTSLLSNGIASVNSAHMTVYRYNTNAISTSFDVGTANTGNTAFTMSSYYNSLGAIGYVGDINLRATWAPPNSAQYGYYCASRTTSSRLDLYFANSSNAHSSVANNTGANAVALPPDHFYPFLALYQGGFTDGTDNWLSYFSCGAGLSSAQSSLHYNAVQALRVGLGGGSR